MFLKLLGGDFIMSIITIEEMCNEIISNKHSELNIFFMEKQKMIKGFIKNVTLISENNEKSIRFNLQEIKNEDQILEKHSCKKIGDKCSEGKKDRVIIEINSLEQAKLIEKNSFSDKVTYKIEFCDELIGLAVKL